MNATETAIQAETFFGDKLYQERARLALPLLVRQAKAQQTIFYEDLADEMGMPNPRNLNYPLGSVGQTLLELGTQWGETVPPIQCLVVNQADGLPGEGVGFFIDKHRYKAMSKRQQRQVVADQLQIIFAYSHWDKVLAAFDMKPATMDFSKIVRQAAAGGRGGGESEDHKHLKEYVAAHPELLSLSPRIAKGVNEYRLPSGDELDVLFRDGDEWVAVEVKSHISDDADLVRGLFQCVKYQAVLEAFLLTTNRAPNVRTVLVTERALSPELMALKNMLGIEVIHKDAQTPNEICNAPSK
jgi:hypothetical protein